MRLDLFFNRVQIIDGDTYVVQSTLLKIRSMMGFGRFGRRVNGEVLVIRAYVDRMPSGLRFTLPADMPTKQLFEHLGRRAVVGHGNVDVFKLRHRNFLSFMDLFGYRNPSSKLEVNEKEMLRNRGLSIGDIARRTGLAVSAIRYYEAEGLIRSWRTEGGQRRFERADIRKLSFIMISQELGFSLAEIRSYLGGLPHERAPTQADWKRISKDFRKAIDRRIAGLEALRGKLDGCIGCGCLSLKKCALYNPADRAQRLGTGPRYLRGDRAAID